MKILITIPAKNAANQILPLLQQVINLNYPKEDLTIAICENDSEDQTRMLLQTVGLPMLKKEDYSAIHCHTENFGFKLRPEHRHLPELQKPRLCAIAKARQSMIDNYLPGNDYVMHIDADLTQIPRNTLNILLANKKDIISPKYITKDGKWYDASSSFKGISVAELSKKNPTQTLFEIDKTNCYGLISKKVFDAGAKYYLGPGNGSTIFLGRMAREKGFKMYLTTAVTVVHATINGTKKLKKG